MALSLSEASHVGGCVPGRAPVSGLLLVAQCDLATTSASLSTVSSPLHEAVKPVIFSSIDPFVVCEMATFVI